MITEASEKREPWQGRIFPMRGGLRREKPASRRRGRERGKANGTKEEEAPFVPRKGGPRKRRSNTQDKRAEKKSNPKEFEYRTATPHQCGRRTRGTEKSIEKEEETRRTRTQGRESMNMYLGQHRKGARTYFLGKKDTLLQRAIGQRIRKSEDHGSIVFTSFEESGSRSYRHKKPHSLSHRKERGREGDRRDIGYKRENGPNSPNQWRRRRQGKTVYLFRVGQPCNCCNDAFV